MCKYVIAWNQGMVQIRELAETGNKIDIIFRLFSSKSEKSRKIVHKYNLHLICTIVQLVLLIIRLLKYLNNFI